MIQYRIFYRNFIILLLLLFCPYLYTYMFSHNNKMFVCSLKNLFMEVTTQVSLTSSLLVLFWRKLKWLNLFFIHSKNSNWPLIPIIITYFLSTFLWKLPKFQSKILFQEFKYDIIEYCRIYELISIRCDSFSSLIKTSFRYFKHRN